MSSLMHFKVAAYVIKFHFHQISIWFFNTLRSCALTWINSAITASLSTCATCDLRCCTTASCDSHILGPTRMKPCTPTKQHELHTTAPPGAKTRKHWKNTFCSCACCRRPRPLGRRIGSSHARTRQTPLAALIWACFCFARHPSANCPI